MSKHALVGLADETLDERERAVAAVLLFAPAGAPDAPPLTTLASATERPATGPERLPRDFAGVTFPDWGDELGWRADGRRADRIAGRRAETVFYTHQGHRIGYTVLEGEAYAPPPGGREYEVEGTTVRIYTPAGAVPHDGPHGRVSARVAIFEREGRTCVLAGEVLDEKTLVKLAGWRGDGAVEF